MSALAVLTVRNEGAFLLEWLAHHRATGFTDFLVFSNNCQDGTDAMLDRLSDIGWVTHLRNPPPYDNRGVQFTALKLAQKSNAFRNADWVMALDIDEFVNIHTGDRTLSSLWSALPEATAITLTWRLFGNADQVRYTDSLVTETFTRAAPVLLPWPWRAAMFKTLFRNDGTYSRLGVHRPRNPDPDRIQQARWFDGEGRELDDQFKTRRIFSNYGQSNYKLAQLNHYPLGAMESFVIKADRGRAVHSEQTLDVDYWVERNLNTDTDTSIHKISPVSRPILDELMADSELKILHKQAVSWRRRRFEELLHKEPYRALFARLLMTPQSRTISRSSARTLASYANKGRALERGDKQD